MKREQRNTLILAAVLFTVLGAAFLVQRVLQRISGDPEAWAVVQAGGRETMLLDLSKDVEFQLGDDEIGYNLVRVEDGKIMVAEADCPDGICVYTGAINQPGELIACLPHGLIIYIKEAGEQN
ncbi:MAG: NusG domain II-containing protein [Ruminococcus flavefaciens]|nr:NusG domain II-containing protein [Ruminococcus flavefaciens]